MTKIFMAEDDPFMTRLYERSFKDTGYQFETATDGDDAIAKLQAMDVPPALIMLDVMMPKKNGLVVLQEIKKNEKLKNIPIIMLTNLADDTDVDNALNSGALLYLVKSQYGPRQIVEKVNEIIANQDNLKKVSAPINQ